MNENDFEKKSTKKVGIIVAIIISAIVIVGIVGAIIYFQLAKKPEKLFAKAIKSTFAMKEKEKAKSARVDLELSAESNTLEEAIQTYFKGVKLKNLKIKTISEADLDKKILNENIIVLYDEQEVINASALLQNEKIYAYLKDLYSKYIEIDEEDLGNVDLSKLFESEVKIDDKKLLEDLKQILLDEVSSKKLTQEKAELDGKKTLKSTLKLSEKEILQLSQKILKKFNEYAKSEPIEDLLYDIKYELEYESFLEDKYLEISLYTKGLKNELVKSEFVINNEDSVSIIEVNKKSDDEMEINFYNKDLYSKASETTKLATFTIIKKDENSGNIKIQINIDDETSVTLNIKYKVENNVNIEEKNIQNSIKARNFTQTDLNEIMNNVQKNKILFPIIQEAIGQSTTPTESALDLEDDFNTTYQESYTDLLNENDF